MKTLLEVLKEQESYIEEKQTIVVPPEMEIGFYRHPIENKLFFYFKDHEQKQRFYDIEKICNLLDSLLPTTDL